MPYPLTFALVFALGKKAPWLDHLSKPYRRRCGTCAARAPQSHRQSTRNTS